MTNQNSALADTTESEFRRYANGRLGEAERFLAIEKETKQRIKKLLSKLTGRVEAGGASVFISGLRDQRLATAGHTNLAAHFREPDETMLFSGEIAKSGDRFIQPIESNGYVIGYLSILVSESRCTELVEEMFEMYADLILHELELAVRKSALEDIPEKLQKKKEELEKAQEYNSSLLSITSHDLSSPLNAVSGYLDLMRDCFKNDSKIDQIENYHQRIQAGVQDVMEMLQQLSDISKIERGAISLDMVDVNLSWLAHRVCELIESNAIEKDITFSWDAPDHPVYVKADTVKFKRVIHNLVANAIKYTARGGNVKVEVGQAEDRAILKVKDNGMGIAESHYSKIFAPFVKLKKSDNHSSSGLGLYVASYFTDLMNGEISVESRENEGSAFTISLPLVESLMAQSC